MGHGTWYYSLGVSSIVDAFVRSEFGISSWRGSRVDGRSYLQSGAIDGSEANGIIRDPKSCKVRVGSNGNLLWEASVLYDEKKGCVMETLKFAAMPFGLTNTPSVFMELMSKEEKVYVNFSNNMEAKPRESYLEEEGIKWQAFGSILSRREREIACTLRHLKVLMKDCMTNVSRWMKLFNEYGFKAKYHLGKANVVVESWSRRKSEAKNEFWIDVRISIWRDVRTLAIEEAYTTKYSIHPGADTMLCGFRLTNRWLSMKKDIASCGSKYLACVEMEVKYKGSSGLLLRPEIPEWKWYGYIRNRKKIIKNKQTRARERKSEQKPEAKA
ncbi:hypothetical protein Tco_0038185 [Tanacetum coccineum]